MSEVIASRRSPIDLARRAAQPALGALLLALAGCGSRTALDGSATGTLGQVPDDAAADGCIGPCVRDAAMVKEASLPEAGPVEASIDAAGALCGGFAGMACADGFWCDLGACKPPVDGTGICRAIPGDSANTCPIVCACDGHQYCNAYEAFVSGVLVAPGAACASAPCNKCGSCLQSQWCATPDPVTGRDSCIKSCRPGVCLQRPTGCGPLGGGICACNGQAFEDSCEAHAAGADVASSGRVCGG